MQGTSITDALFEVFMEVPALEPGKVWAGVAGKTFFFMDDSKERRQYLQ